jgi:hypothetical protein
MATDPVEVGGGEPFTESFTQLGQALERLEQMAGKLGTSLGGLDQTLATVAERVEAATGSLGQSKARTPDPEKEAAAQAAREQADAQQLRARVAAMVGGGVNYAAYEQQLTKIRDQMNLITEAEQRQVIGHREASEALGKLRVQYGKLQAEAAAYAAVGGGGLGRIAASVTQKVTALPETVVGAAKNQVTGIGTGIMGLIAQTPIAGGLFGLMLWGQMNRDRIAAETGEIVNIAVAAGGKLTQSATGFLGSFQQQAEHYFGINRQEVQGVLKTFVDAGVSIEDILKKQKDSLGLVGHDIMTLTLGIDRHFELANGTSARGVVSLMQDYGMSVEKAGDLYERLAFAGSRSGMGVQNFLNYVQQGAGALRQYGFGVENVAGVILKLQERYEALGVPKQLAGNLAGQAVGQIAQGISSMSAGQQAYYGERLGMGTGLEARMKFRDGMQRMAQGNVGDTELKLMAEMRKTAMEAAGGDQAQARFFLEQQGMGFEGAKAIMEIGGEVDKGVKIGDLSLKEQKALKDAFKTEGQKQSDIQKNIHTMMQGMAQVGEGLLQIVTNFAAIGIVFFKTMPALLFGSDDERKATMEVMKGFWSDVAQGANKMWGGAKGIGSGVYGLIQPIVKPLEQAIGWNPYGVNNDVVSFRVAQAGQRAEQQELDRRFGGTEAGKAVRQMSDRMLGSTSGAVRSMAGTVDDIGILMTGLNTAAARGADWLKSAVGLGDNRMERVRQEAMGDERAQIVREGRTPTPQAASPPAPRKVTITVKPAYPNRPHTPP